MQNDEKKPVGHPTRFPGANVKISARITERADAIIERHAARLQVTYSQAIEWLIRRGNRRRRKKVVQ